MVRNLGDFHDGGDAVISQLAFKRGSPLVTALNDSPHGCQNRLAVWTVVTCVGAGGFEPPTSRSRTKTVQNAPPSTRVVEFGNHVTTKSG
jgi:hypothetical protein